MATTQRKTTGGKRTASSGGKRSGSGTSTARKSGGSRSRNTAPQPKPIRREVGAVVCLLLAFFAAFGYFNIQALFIDLFCSLLKGLFGYGKLTDEDVKKANDFSTGIAKTLFHSLD